METLQFLIDSPVEFKAVVLVAFALLLAAYVAGRVLYGYYVSEMPPQLRERETRWVDPIDPQKCGSQAIAEFETELARMQGELDQAHLGARSRAKIQAEIDAARKKLRAAKQFIGRAENMGRIAEDADECPYEIGTAAYEAWFRGHFAAMGLVETSDGRILSREEWLKEERNFIEKRRKYLRSLRP